MSLGTTLLGRRHVLPSVTSSLTELMVEGTFPSGTYLVTVHNPISTDDGNLERALYGSFLPVPGKELFPLHEEGVWEVEKMPGAVVCVKEKGEVRLSQGRHRKRLKVESRGDRPIQVCSIATRGDLQSTGPMGVEVLTGANCQGRVTLPLYRDKSSARLRSHRSVWIPTGYSCWDICAV